VLNVSGLGYDQGSPDEPARYGSMTLKAGLPVTSFKVNFSKAYDAAAI